jgi:hypothetical protein
VVSSLSLHDQTARCRESTCSQMSNCKHFRTNPCFDQPLPDLSPLPEKCRYKRFALDMPGPMVSRSWLQLHCAGRVLIEYSEASINRSEAPRSHRSQQSVALIGQAICVVELNQDSSLEEEGGGAPSCVGSAQLSAYLRDDSPSR